MTGPRRLALQGWIVIGLLVLILLGIVGLGIEIKPCRTYGVVTRRAPTWRDDGGTAEGHRRSAVPVYWGFKYPGEARPNTLAQAGIDKNLAKRALAISADGRHTVGTRQKQT